ncbi:hypothetical protein MBLNU457_g0105t1 [Dothideomycetes sp. NU457]
MKALTARTGATQNRFYLRCLIVIWAIAAILRDGLFSPPTTSLSATFTLLIQPLWLYRVLRYDDCWHQDLLICLLADYWRNGGLQLLKPGFYQWLEQTQSDHKSVYAIMGLSVLFSTAIVLRGDPPQKPVETKTTPKSVDEHLLPPLLIPGRTTHTRLFPKKHSFSYSYFYVGIPVGWKGRAGSSLSADVDLLPLDDRRYGWFHVDAADYLTRGDHPDGLEGKLRQYLRSEGIADSAWSFAYFVTAPKFLGYSFNPVSFWYIYDDDITLKLMVLEVNNTFGERRLYLLKAVERAPKRATDAINTNEEDEEVDMDAPTGSVKFTNAWSKDFHVSPFNSRKGSYTLVAKDPVNTSTGQGAMIDNTITLRSSKEHPKIVARVFSVGAAKDPTKIATLEICRFLLSWFWVGFVTFPRIIKEAFKLFFFRKLHVWYRPEVLPSSIGRSHVDIEEELEAFFRAFLSSLVKQCQSPVKVIYRPAGGMGEDVVMTCSAFRPGVEPGEVVVRVLSPAFYSRFVHYAHTAEAFDREGYHTDEKNRTVDISDPELLAEILRPTGDHIRAKSEAPRSVKSGLRWNIMKRLRCPPAAVPYPEPSPLAKKSNTQVDDIRTFGYSPMDCFVMDQCEDAAIYRKALTKLFLAELYAAGITALVTAADLTIRGLLLVFSMRLLSTMFPFSFEGLVSFDSVKIADSGIGLLLANLIHAWSLAKGL